MACVQYMFAYGSKSTWPLGYEMLCHKVRNDKYPTKIAVLKWTKPIVWCQVYLYIWLHLAINLLDLWLIE
jgi:hypothetical protein